MAAKSRQLLLLSAGAVVAIAQQPSETPSPSTTAQSAGSAATPTTTDRPMELWSIADGLLTSYYPSTSLDGVSSLTWPDPVVIGGTTYNVPSSGAISTSASSPTSTSEFVRPTNQAGTDNVDEPSKAGPFGDKKLGIIIGCVIGLVALVVMILVFWCLRRRKNDTGSFFMRRRTPSIGGSSVASRRSWLPGGRSDTYGNVAYVTAGASHEDGWEKQPEMAARPQRPHVGEPRMSQHPAFAAVRRAGSSRSTSEDNPFYTPAERMDAQLGHNNDLEQGPYDPHPIELDNDGQPRPRSSDSLRASGERPPTPFSPMEMMGFGAARAAPSSQVEARDFGHNPAQALVAPTNPFSSPDDEEADVVSPILPSKSAERRHSPMVHYPSWSEVSSFDFQGDGRQGLRNVSSVDTDGGDGWRPTRERTDGRYELA